VQISAFVPQATPVFARGKFRYRAAHCSSSTHKTPCQEQDPAPWQRTSSLPAYLKVVDRRIATLFKCHFDPLHDEIVDFAAPLKSGLAQCFVDMFGQVKARMDHVRPWPVSQKLSTVIPVLAIGCRDKVQQSRSAKHLSCPTSLRRSTESQGVFSRLSHRHGMNVPPPANPVCASCFRQFDPQISLFGRSSRTSALLFPFRCGRRQDRPRWQRPCQSRLAKTC